nr:nuclear transport factor 2 family protein [Rhizobium sp. AN80A]
MLQSLDYDQLMRANLTRVFNERDPARRLEAIAELYTRDAVLNEPDATFSGHAAISQAVTDLLDGFPADFSFTAIGPAIGHHSIGRLRWSSGPPSGPAAVTGMDIIQVEDGRIHSLHVFIEPNL